MDNLGLSLKKYSFMVSGKPLYDVMKCFHDLLLGSCTTKSLFFLFFWYDDSGHVEENSSMILNSGDFIYCVFF